MNASKADIHRHLRCFIAVAGALVVRRLCLFLVVSLAVALSSLAVAGSSPAGATVRPTIWTSSADLFWCTSTQDLCQNHPLAHISQGTPLKMVCWVDDRGMRWFYSYLDNGQEGYFWSAQVANQTPNTRSCNGINWLQSASFAIGHLGQTAPLPGDGPNPQPSTWYGNCLLFAYDAWRSAGTVPAAPTTSNTYPGDVWSWYLTHQRSSVHLESDGVTRPPRGAMVFWSNPDPHFWHVAISIGNWQAIGTYHAGSPNNVSQYGVLTAGYTGWIMPATPTIPQNPS
jgi:hypothetical protein